MYIFCFQFNFINFYYLGETTVRVEIFSKDPVIHIQPPFKYQEKCFAILQVSAFPSKINSGGRVTQRLDFSVSGSVFVSADGS
jgi:hypothetical protein